ncbi:MAG: ADP-ribosylglycohydrolase family protein [Gammaproteobacteria bacterium]|nr:ADP-ribosylglycohydrolase family protein [Gammaproteobacteria bacterium]
MNPIQPREDQFIGALLGCAVGDALGAPLEGRSREEIAEVTDLMAGFHPFRSHSAGQFTDDTQQTVAIAQSIVDAGRVDGAAIAREFAKLWESGEIVGQGPVADRAVKRLIAGVSWHEAAETDDLPLNGSAMRVSPVGLWNFDRTDQLAADATISSIVTHQHPLAIAGAIATATAVACACTSSEIDTDTFLRLTSESVAGHGAEFASHILALRDWLALDETAALEAMVAAGGESPWAKRREGFGIPATVEPTVLASLYAFLKCPDDYPAAAECSIRVGGDVDTTAAITGAISGAHNGVDAIPGHLVASVKDSAEIQDLGSRLFAARFPKGV